MVKIEDLDWFFRTILFTLHQYGKTLSMEYKWDSENQMKVFEYYKNSHKLQQLVVNVGYGVIKFVFGIGPFRIPDCF